LENGNIEGISPKLAVIMIGTNNSGRDKPEQTAEGVTLIVQKLRKELPETKILLLAVFPRGAGPDDAKRNDNDGVNQVIAKLDDSQMIHYLDIADAFLESDGTLSKEVMPDLLHLNAASYQKWADAIEPSVKKLMAN
jgi:beta-glucosidase